MLAYTRQAMMEQDRRSRTGAGDRPCESCVHTCPKLHHPSSASPSFLSPKRRDERRLQSSPGYLHAGHVPSKCTWQIPQTSSSGMSQRHVATASHFLILTFIVATDVVKC